MTIKDLPMLTPIEAFWLNAKPLNNDFLVMIQETKFYWETRHVNPEWWQMHENKLAHLLKFNNNAAVTFKQEAVQEHGQEVIDNAYRHMGHLLKRTNISPVALQYAAISWYINEMIDIDKTKEQNNWQWTIKTGKK